MSALRRIFGSTPRAANRSSVGRAWARRHRKFFAIVEQRMKIASDFARQSHMLGLERTSTPPMDLNAYIAQRYGQNGDADATPADDPVKEEP